MGDHTRTPWNQMAPTPSSSLRSSWITTTPGSSPMHIHHKTTMHMTFFWGHNTEVLFAGWPGPSKAMYALALLFVFALAVIVEWFSYSSIIKPGTHRVAAGFFQTGMHAVRSGLSYMVLLAVMSFNGGVFLAAVGGHALGFLVFGIRAVRKAGWSGSVDLPPVRC